MHITGILSNAGSGASASLLGTDRHGSLTLTTGMGAGDGGQLTADFDDPDLAINPNARFTPLDGPTAALTFSLGAFVGGNPATGIQLNLSGVASSTTYKWAYRID